MSRNAPSGASTVEWSPGADDGRPERENMKNLSECKEYYKDLYMDCLENDSFEKSNF